MTSTNAPTMSAYDAICARRTAHSYTSTPVPSDAIQRAFDAANHAPCHRRTFPWRFVHVGPNARQAIGELAVQIKAEAHPITEEEAHKVRNKIRTPAELIVALQLRCPDSFQAKEDYAACACAIQNFFISLAGEGIHSKWSTGGITRDPRTYALLNIDPTALESIGFLWVGHAETIPQIKRLPTEQVVHHVS